MRTGGTAAVEGPGHRSRALRGRPLTGRALAGRTLAGPPKRRIGTVLAVAALAAVLLPGAKQAGAWITSDPPIHLPDPGPCRQPRPELTIPLLDVSGSVIASGGADPAGRSFRETRLLAELLAEHPCTDQDEFATIVFGDRPVSAGSLPLTQLASVQQAIARPAADATGGGTNIAAALAAARQIVDAHPGFDVTVIVLSDMVDDHAADVAAELMTLGRDRVHLVALGAHDSQFDGRFDSVVSISHARRADVAYALAKVIADRRKG